MSYSKKDSASLRNAQKLMMDKAGKALKAAKRITYEVLMAIADAVVLKYKALKNELLVLYAVKRLRNQKKQIEGRGRDVVIYA